MSNDACCTYWRRQCGPWEYNNSFMSKALEWEARTNRFLVDVPVYHAGYLKTLYNLYLTTVQERGCATFPRGQTRKIAYSLLTSRWVFGPHGLYCRLMEDDFLCCVVDSHVSQTFCVVRLLFAGPRGGRVIVDRVSFAGPMARRVGERVSVVRFSVDISSLFDKTFGVRDFVFVPFGERCDSIFSKWILLALGAWDTSSIHPQKSRTRIWYFCVLRLLFCTFPEEFWYRKRSMIVTTSESIKRGVLFVSHWPVQLGIASAEIS